MNAPLNLREQGLFQKFNVSRLDGRDAPGEKHHGAEYFVLDLSDDPHAVPAIAAYAASCASDYPALSADLLRKIAALELPRHDVVTVPETTLPGGLVVPAFRVGRFLASKSAGDLPQSTRDGAPWVRISYHDARRACESAGLALITETQALAIAWQVSQQDINWTGGKVGEGNLYQGLHKHTVDGAQPASVEPADTEERRWFRLANGERLYDISGNAFSWVFDDIQGDEHGLIAKAFAADSPSIATAPYPSMKKGIGWQPDAGADWSGNALVRGGSWSSDANAGAFSLSYVWPSFAIVYVGFRCTYPGL